MANKTQLSGEDPEAFINATADSPQKRQDALDLMQLMSVRTGYEPRMWGPSMVGFGTYHYKSERSRQEGDWPVIAFSPRKAAISIYGLSLGEEQQTLLHSLGKFKTGKGCLYIKKLADIDLRIFEKLIEESMQITRRRFGTT